MDVVLDERGPDLFVLAGYQHSAYAYELKVLLGNYNLFKVPVNQVDSHEQALHLQFELEVDLDDPVNEDAPHPFRDVRLLLHVLHPWLVVFLYGEVVL